MKKIILAFALFTFIANSTNAQKLYATKSAQVKFNASGGIEAIGAQNNQVDSKMIDKTGQLVFSMLIKGFRFPNQLMEDHFNENYMESTKYPKADFKGYIKDIALVNFSKDGTYNVTAEGDLSIHGVAKKIAVPGTITITNGKVLIKSDFKVKVKEYGINGSYIGDKIAAEVAVSLNCKYD